MLVLSRKVGEELVLTNGVSIMVVKIEKNQIKLGITAPNDVRILRKELVDENRPNSPRNPS